MIRIIILVFIIVVICGYIFASKCKIQCGVDRSTEAVQERIDNNDRIQYDDEGNVISIERKD